MFKLVVSDTLVVPVSGVAQVAGRDAPFSFELLCRRSTADELRGEIKRLTDEEINLPTFMRERITGWRGVLDESGAALDFGDQAVDALLNFPGVAALAYTAYMNHCGAKGKEKNSPR